MITRFSALFATVFTLSAPLALAVTFPVAAFARQSGNSTVAPGGNVVLTVTQGSTALCQRSYVLWEIKNSSGNIIARSVAGEQNGWQITVPSQPVLSLSPPPPTQLQVTVPQSATVGTGLSVTYRNAERVQMYVFDPATGVATCITGYNTTDYLSQAFDVTAAPVLTATATEADATNLSWTDTPSETAYRVERKNAAGAWEAVQTLAANTTVYTNTGLTENTNYRYQVVAVVGNANVPSNEAAVTTPYSAPQGLIAVSTGSGKITLYFGAKAGAIGYNVYRGTVSGGENYAAPVNGNIPITTRSHPNADTLMFTDTGLTDGIEYFYTAKAVYASSIYSNVSVEDVAIADPNAIPWDTRDSTLIANATVALAGRPITGGLRVMGPDGCVYEAQVGSNAVSPTVEMIFTNSQASITPLLTPSSSWIPDAVTTSPQDRTWVDRNNIVYASPDPLVNTTPRPAITTGPVRRLLSKPNYLRTTAQLTLPDVFQSPYSYNVNRAVAQYDQNGELVRGSNGDLTFRLVAWNTDDTPHIYLGSSNIDGSAEVDAGLIYQKTADGQNYWRPYMNFSKKNEYKGSLMIPTTYSSMYARSLFTPGERVSLNYWVRDATPTERPVVQPQSEASYVAVAYLEVGESFGLSFTQCGIVKGHRSKKGEVRMKRCNSIAQTFSGSTSILPNGKRSPPIFQQPDYSHGYRKTGSYVRYADWFNIRLYDAVADNSTSVLWLPTVTQEKTDFPDDGSINYNLIFGAYYNERQLSIDMRP